MIFENKKILSVEKMCDMLKQYLEQCSQPLFVEYLLTIGWTWNDYNTCVTTNPTSRHSKLLTKIKTSFDIEIEKQIIYQTNPNRFYNYKIAWEYLCKTNNARFGSMPKLTTSTTNQKAKMLEFNNESEIKLLDLDKS